MSAHITYHKKIGSSFLVGMMAFGAWAQPSTATYKLVKTIRGQLSPKSITNNGQNKFFAQNMMYNHSVTVYDSACDLVTTISDKVKPAELGQKDMKGDLTGAPVESIATKDGKYLWVSNYNMSGDGYNNPGCDTCYGKKYDASFVYKINTATYKVENMVKVGSVPKFLSITPDQKKLIVSNWSSGDVSIIDLNTEMEIKRINVGPAPRGIAIDSGSHFAYIAVMGCNKIIRMDLNSYECERFASDLRNPRHLCIDDNYLYTTLNGEQSVCRISLATGKIDKLTVGKAPRSMVLSKDYNELFVDCYEDNKIAVVDLADFKITASIKTNPYPIGICLSNRSKQIWVSCYTGSVQVFSVEQPENQIASTTKKENVVAAVKNPPAKPLNLQIGYPTAIEPVVFTKTTELKVVDNYYVVLGSFSVKENALNLKNKLTKKGVRVELVDSRKGYIYCACKTNTKDDSEKLIAELETLTGIKGWVYQS
jgi:YVTN family beta-propeller protein